MYLYIKVLEDINLPTQSKLIFIYICEKYISKYNPQETEIDYETISKKLGMDYQHFKYYYELLENNYLDMRTKPEKLKRIK